MPYSAPLDSPYDPSVAAQDPETWPMDEVLAEAMRSHTMGLRVALPASVLQVTSGQNQKVDVQPSLMSRSMDAASAEPMPAIKNVPVLMLSGQNYSIKLPIAVGDQGLLVFCDRSIDAWVASDGSAPVDPQDTRQHDLTDAVFIPGLVPFAQQLADTTTDMVFKAGNAQLRLQQDGKVTLGASQELFSLLDQFIGSVNDLMTVLTTQTFTLTQMGPQPFIGSTLQAINNVVQGLADIRTNLRSITGGGS